MEKTVLVKPQLAEKVELMKLALEIAKTQATDGVVSSDTVKLIYEKLYGMAGSVSEIPVDRVNF